MKNPTVQVIKDNCCIVVNVFIPFVTKGFQFWYIGHGFIGHGFTTQRINRI